MKDTIRHILNPLHVYCRLINVGLDAPKAKAICRFYQKLYSLVL
ncbi:hypothetical protein [Desulfonatronospira sp.]|nr:hypothetical protein [Desulfonatronospira sp.]